MGSIIDYARIIMNKLERHVIHYTPFRVIMYDALLVKQKFNVFKRLRATKTSFG
jgi:hypothetical protein